jgi:hypothetical protein
VNRVLGLAASTALVLGVAPCTHAEVLRTGGPGQHSLNLSVATDTLPGTSATQYRVPAAAPVVVRYTLVNSSEAGILNLHVNDPDIPSAAISCAGGTALLPPLATRQCTATVPAADGRRVRNVTATGTLAWFGTRVTASASTGYVGYQAALTVHELVAGASTDPNKPDTLVVGAPVRISYQMTNTGDVPLSGLGLHSSLNGAGCSPDGQLLPGEQVTCILAPRAADGLHVDSVVASAEPQLTVLSGDGGLAAPPPVSASDQGAYVGVAVAAPNGGGRAAAVTGRGRSGNPMAGRTLRSALVPGGGSAGGSGAGTSPVISSSATAANSASNSAHHIPLAQSGAGFSGLIKPAHQSRPWMMVIFLVVLVPVVLRLARANRSSD